MFKRRSSENKFCRLVPQLCLLTVTALTLVAGVVILFNSTLGWFSNNRNVSGEGMGVSVEVTPNLVVSDSASDIALYTNASWSDSYVMKTWTEQPIELIPADHYTASDYPTVSGVNTFDLVYNDNPENVNRTTGRSKGAGEELTFAYVPADGEDVYFIDRTIYIASLDAAMTLGEDYTTVSFAMTGTGTDFETETAFKSASADVYIDGVFKGTLNLDTLGSFTISDISEIPLNTSSSIAVLFRCYFDGALASSATSNYVNSKDLANSMTNIAVAITITVE